jgi:hypothetical protein
MNYKRKWREGIACLRTKIRTLDLQNMKQVTSFITDVRFVACFLMFIVKNL